jgi:hypothetical protein
MKICWQKDFELTVIAFFDEDNNVDVTEIETIKAGEEDEVTILADHGETVDIKFSYGTIARNVDRKLFIEVK